MNFDSSSSSDIRHALIIAAGRGSRFKSGTANRPKPLIEVDGCPLILHVIKSAVLAGISQFTIITGYLGDILKDYLACEIPNMKIRFIHNPEWERANGISVFRASGLMPHSFALLMSDHFFDPRILQRLASVPLKDGFCRLAVDFNPSGVPDLEDATKVMVADGRVLDIGKGIKKYNGIDTGVFLCSHAIFTALEKSISKGAESLSDAIRELARLKKMEAMDIGGLFWIDIDEETSLLKAEAALKGKSQL